MNIVDEVVNKIDIIEECKGWRQFSFFFLWMFSKPHTVVSFPNVALCEVKHGHTANGEL